MVEMWMNHGLIVGLKKTEVMKLDPNEEEPPDPPYKLIDEYKYLGTEISPPENWEKTVKKYIK